MKKVIVLLFLFCLAMPAYCETFGQFRETLLNPNKNNNQQVVEEYTAPKKYVTSKTDSVYRDGNGKIYQIGNKKVYRDLDGNITSIDR